jgi:uncharacterized protein
MSDDVSTKTPESFLGTGWSFPPDFVEGTGPGQGQVRMTSDEEDIACSLRILFGTALGERFLRPKYGLDMHELLFEAVNTTTKTYLEDRIRTSIAIHEPRIKLISLVLDDSGLNGGYLGIRLEYEVRATNSRYNLVYPFYDQDGNEARFGLGSGRS